MRELDGHQLYGAFREGALRVQAARAELDRINVFPVADGDTGSNMAATARAAVDRSRPQDSAAATLGAMADAALDGARGNSGAIFAQFLSGFAESCRDAASLSLERFARGMEHAARAARRAIDDPREGTILSVAHDWAQALAREYEASESFIELLRAAAPTLRRSLAETRHRLEVLERSGVVDAGASGFVEFMDGARDYLESGAPARRDGVPDGVPGPEESLVAAVPPEAPGEPPSDRRYCCEFLLEARPGLPLDADALRSSLHGLGDSVIVAGRGQRLRVHVHAGRPDRLLEAVAARGRVVEQKVDDMLRQHVDSRARRARVAILTDSSCDLPLSILDAHAIHVVPLVLRFGETEYLDRLTLDPARFYDLADASPVHPTSSQPPRPVFERAYRELLSRYEEVVSIHLSGRLSGTLAASRAAADAVDPRRIRVLDSRHLSGSLGLLALRAAEAVEAGADAAAVEAALPLWSRKAEILVSVPTLRYMVRGGRVSPLGGALARILDLKPIVSVDGEGASRLYGASLGVRKNLDRIVAMTVARHGREPLRSWAVVHAGDERGALALALRLEDALGFPPLHVSPISAVVGLNAGRGAIAVVAMSE